MDCSGYLSVPIFLNIPCIMSSVSAGTQMRAGRFEDDPCVKLNQMILAKLSSIETELLHDELRRMHCILKDSHVDHIRMRSRWIQEVRKLVWDAEDFIDNVALLDRQANPQQKNTIYNLRHRLKLFYDRHKIWGEIKALNRKMLKNNGQNTNEEVLLQLPCHDQNPIRNIVGLEEESTNLVQQLLSDGTRLVISVVGVGGIGKSTLARKVYEDSCIRSGFELRAWISMTQCFDHRHLLVQLLSSIKQVGEDELNNRTTEKLQELVYDHLRECTSYLIVLDDVWGPRHKSGWERLLKTFPDAQEKTRILVTTRLNEVAVCASPIEPFRMKHLDEEDSWELFSLTAGIKKNIDVQDIARQITRGCNGLPILIVSMGSKFSGGKWRADWEEKLKHMEKDQDPLPRVRERLELSYNDLESELKHCFLFVGFFPENYTIPTRTLINLWIAQGLISGQEGQKAEDEAESHLNTLVKKNMIHPVQVSPDGRIKDFTIDSSLRKLCIIKAREEILLHIQDEGKFQPTEKHRHRAIHGQVDRYFDSNDSCPLRSFVSFVPKATISRAQLVFICKRFRLLKILHLEGMIVECLPNEVGQLCNLKYLNLRSTGVEELPSSICHLKKLLTLDIRDNRYIRDLAVVKDMTDLQNLYLPGMSSELELQNLPQLQTLKGARVTSAKALDSLSKLAALHTLQLHLGGTELNLDYLLDLLKELKHLESLYLNPDMRILSLATDKFKYLASLAKLYIKGGVRRLPKWENFPPNLRQLTLDESAQIPFPLVELEKLPKLSILRLRNLYIEGQKLSFSTDGFPRLKYLELKDLWNLQALELQGSGALSWLKHLKISNCTTLDSLPGEQLPALSEIEIDRMRETFETKVLNWHGVQPVIKVTNTFISSNVQHL